MNEFGIKELYDVTLKATYQMEVGTREIEIGETVAAFENIQIANLQEHKKTVTAKGGSGNRTLIWWEDTEDIALSLQQGIFSKETMALMLNANLLHNEGPSSIKINQREIVESDSDGRVQVKHLIASPYFVYNQATGEKLKETQLNGNIIYTAEPYTDFLVDYYYEYNNGYDVLTIGNPLTNGFLSLEGKTRVKDDTTGQVKTGIIRIPKLKLLSNLSMRLGKDAIPQVGRLDALAVPTGPKGQKMVMELIFLEDDIDSDM